MGRIRLLDPQVINQIAAGEVVERPASVVKELVENSLDAGARRVRVTVEEGGLRSIVVADDGCGMSPEDAALAVERHATSKITRLEDLLTAGTLGFRGEALAAIAAVARLELVTRPPEAEAGYRVVVEGGTRRAAGPWASPPGTRVAVRDLFFNTPARRKHLKGPAAEFARIADVVTAHALARPEVRFELVHNGREVLRTSGSGDRAVVVLECFGPEVAGALIPVAAGDGPRQVEGYVGAPRVARASRAWQFFSINRRPVQHAGLRFSLENAYRHLLPGRRYPVAVLDVTLPPEEVDVNVHPAKLEVRLARERAVGALVYRAVQQALASRDLLRPGGSGGLWGNAGPGEPPHPPGEGGAGRTGAPGGAPELSDPLGSGGPREPGRPVEPQGSVPGEAGGPGGPGEGTGASPGGGGVPRGWLRSGPLRPGTPRPVRGASWLAGTAGPAAPGVPGHEAVPDGTTELRRSPGPGRPWGPGLVSGEVAAGYDPAAWLEVYRPVEGEAGGAGRPARQAPDLAAAEGPAESAAGAGPAGAGRAGFLRQLRPLGQVAGTYLACAGPDGLYLIDQHAAHERIYFEHFLRLGASREGVPAQMLAVPAVVDLPPSEHALLLEHAGRIARLGFRVEPFGPRSVVVRAVPAALADRPAAGLLADLLSRLLAEALTGGGGTGSGEEGEPGEGSGAGGEAGDEAVLDTDRAARILAACKAAIKAGDPLHPAEMDRLLRDLAACRQPYTCPHGRPTVVRLGVEQLERMFGRRGG